MKITKQVLKQMIMEELELEAGRSANARRSAVKEKPFQDPLGDLPKVETFESALEQYEKDQNNNLFRFRAGTLSIGEYEGKTILTYSEVGLKDPQRYTSFKDDPSNLKPSLS